jgi:hypothetical protein
MHPYHLTGVMDSDVKTLDIMVRQLSREQLPVPDKNYGNLVLAGSNYCPLNLNPGSIVATHGIYGNSHTHKEPFESG